MKTHPHRNLPAIAALFLAAAGACWAADTGPGKPDASRPANPLNPLTGNDPFVGTFESPDLTIVIRREGASYAGEVNKSGQTFPFKATRKDNLLHGAFEFEGHVFEFYVMVDGDGVSFNTPLKLSRKKGAVAVARPTVPAPTTTPAPPATTQPATPAPPPAVTRQPDPPPLAPIPPRPNTTPATPANAGTVVAKPITTLAPAPTVGPDGKPLAALPGRAWAGFPEGAYVLMEDTIKKGDLSPINKRSVLVFRGLKDGKEMVQPCNFNGTGWEITSNPLPWLGSGRAPEDLDYKLVSTSTDLLDIKDRTLQCTVSEYTREDKRDGRIYSAHLKIWRAGGITLPGQPLVLPEGTLLLDSGVVRVKREGDDKTTLDYKLSALAQPFRIGQQNIEVAAFRGAGTSQTPEGPFEVALERLISAQVPGGLVRIQIDTHHGLHHMTNIGVAVEVGVSKTEGGIYDR